MLFSELNSPIVLIRGGGDLASGVALRLHHAGFKVLITELPEPLVVRRLASFAQVIFSDHYQLEDVNGILVYSAQEAKQVMEAGNVAVMIDPIMEVRDHLPLLGLVDGRMCKKAPELGKDAAPIVIGLGPGFTAGLDCHAVVETNRGPFLGRVYWTGTAEKDSGVPESVKGYTVERVLYSPANGKLHARAEIGEVLEKGSIIAEVEGEPVTAKFRGVLRGLIQNGLTVKKNMKIGDLDPRCDPKLCAIASDKALAIGGGVLEALLASIMKGQQ
jgi:xanthine dehydrogenase accessory factor